MNDPQDEKEKRSKSGSIIHCQRNGNMEHMFRLQIVGNTSVF